MSLSQAKLHDSCVCRKTSYDPTVSDNCLVTSTVCTSKIENHSTNTSYLYVDLPLGHIVFILSGFFCMLVCLFVCCLLTFVHFER